MSSSDGTVALTSSAPAVLAGEFAKKVFRYDPRIRHFGVIDAKGEEILSASRPGLVSLEPGEETRKVIKQIALMKGILEGQNKYHGRIRSAAIVRDKIAFVMFDGVDKVFMFSAEPDFPLSKIERLGKMLDTLEIE